MKTLSELRKIIQGGMGVNISSWFLARTVSLLGQHGTISGVEIERITARVLQLGDPGGHIRQALRHFPFPHIAEKVIKAFYVEDGGKPGQVFKNTPVISLRPSPLLIALMICSNFAVVWLAKQGHSNPISINYLEKVSIPHVYAITGAVLADVDYITMGAGLPMQIPELLNDLVEGRQVKYRVPVDRPNGKSIPHELVFNPAEFLGGKLPPLNKPGFIPIISSNILAEILNRKLSRESIQGLVIEGPSAGGHNAPVRELTFEKIRNIGWPFWIGGASANSEQFHWALEQGAVGIQAGSIFALSNESGMEPMVRSKIRKLGFEGKLQVRTDLRISPTGYPFKVLVLDGTLSETSVIEKRVRNCSQGALVTAYERPNGTFGFRCPAEPVDVFVAKGGNIEETVGRGCLCNGLNSTAGYGDENEPMVITAGDDLSFLKSPLLMPDINSSYSAAQAIKYILG
jgi:NAD(P)H-dependent flavin oxidoreductase YrpB (nitropropane dioxygenase family)